MKVKKIFKNQFLVIAIVSLMITAIPIKAQAASYTVTVYDITDTIYRTSDYFSINAGQSVTISWSGGKDLNMFLYNSTTGNMTSFKSSTSSITYTGMNAGNYRIHVHANQNYGYFDQLFSITTK